MNNKHTIDMQIIIERQEKRIENLEKEKAALLLEAQPAQPKCDDQQNYYFAQQYRNVESLAKEHGFLSVADALTFAVEQKAVAQPHGDLPQYEWAAFEKAYRHHFRVPEHVEFTVELFPDVKPAWLWWQARAILAGQQNGDSRKFDAKRLRRVVNLLELGSAVPDSDDELLANMGAVLGMVARKLESTAETEERWINTGKAIDRACGELPEGYDIHIELENGAGTVRLLLADTDADMTDFGGDDLSYDLNHAIDHAKQHEHETNTQTEEK